MTYSSRDTALSAPQKKLSRSCSSAAFVAMGALAIQVGDCNSLAKYKSAGSIISSRG